MALTLGGDLAATVKIGGYYEFTATDLAITDGDRFVLSTAPTIGHVTRNWLPLAEGDTFTPADITAKLIHYVHDGSGEAGDEIVFGLKAQADGETPTLTDEGDVTMTLGACLGFLLILKPTSRPAQIALFTSQREADILEAQWDAANPGAGAVVEFTTTLDLSSHLTIDGAEVLAESLSINTKIGQQITKMGAVLAKTLEETAYADLKANINTYGGAVLTDREVWNTLTPAEQIQLRGLRTAFDTVPVTFKRPEPEDAFIHALEDLKGTLT